MDRKFHLTFPVAAIMAVTSQAQGKLDLPASLLVGKMELETPAASRAGAASEEVTVIVSLNDGHTAADLEAEGYEVLDSRGGMAIVRIPVNGLEDAASLSWVSSVSVGHEAYAMCDNARTVAGVSDLHAGYDGHSYKGEGVVVGLMDTGLDINHHNFQDASGNPRASRLWVITGANSSIQEFATREKIASYTTDDGDETHGTHTLGIMAGNFNGTSRYALINPRTGLLQIKNAAANPFYGVAPEADIAACAGTLQNSNIIVAGTKVSDYARSQGKPAVFNLSLGNNIGPHDGTDASSRYLAELGKDMIVCISAGNEGDSPMYIGKDFTASDSRVKAFVSSSTTAGGQVDVWSADNTKVDVTFMICDASTGESVYLYKLDRNTGGEQISIVDNRYSGTIKDPEFQKYFQGYVLLSSKIEASNNRYEALTYYNLTPTSTNGGRYLPAIIVEGQPGKHADIYASRALGLYSRSLAGFSQGNSSNSINGMGCGDNVIVVGSYQNRDRWACLDGLYSYTVAGYDEGAISPFSSYGTTFGGKRLPDICGPGGGMVSSYSTYYVDRNMSQPKQICAIATGTKRNSYWASMDGTSMSCPFVAGVVALWLQADPTLTVDEVKGVMEKSSTTDDDTAKDPRRWGYGKINALEGLKQILSSGVDATVADDARLIVEQSGDMVDVFVAGASEIEVAMYSLGGSAVAHARSVGGSVSMSTSSLQSGVYVLSVQTGDARFTRKLIVR